MCMSGKGGIVTVSQEHLNFKKYLTFWDIISLSIDEIYVIWEDMLGEIIYEHAIDFAIWVLWLLLEGEFNYPKTESTLIQESLENVAYETCFLT